MVLPNDYQELFPYSQLDPKLETKESRNARITLLEKQLKELEESQYELDDALVTELEQQITEDCEKSLFAFYQESWPVFEVGDFAPNWHMEAMCEALEAVESGQIDKLILQVPPGCAKSSLSCVSYPAWAWLKDPTLRFMTAAVDVKLVLRDSVRTRSVIQSEWYQSKWSDKFSLTAGNVQKSYYENENNGYRFTTSPSSGAVGRRYDRLLVDDPFNPKDIMSKSAKDEVWRWWNETLSTRSSARGRKVVIHQRLACDDLIGRILETDEVWEVISFPMKYEVNIPYPWAETNILPNRDPRTEEGELLFPQVKTPRIVKTEEKQLGTYGTAAQHQQRPIPLDGGLIKKNCFNYYQIGSKQTFFSRSQQTVGTWDLSFGDSGGSYCVGMVWSQQDGYKKYAVDAYRGKWDWTQQMAYVVQMLNDYPQIRTLLIEKKANGDGIISALRKQIAAGITRPVNIIPVEVNKSKEVRIYMCLSDFEAGNVFIPNPANCDWSGDFVQELTTFPVGANDDYTDNASMFLNWIATSSQNFKSVTFTNEDIKNLHSGNNSQVQTNSYFSDSKGKPLFNISRGYAKDIFS
jgi:predicted phage terminase large subunit-like protein